MVTCKCSDYYYFYLSYCICTNNATGFVIFKEIVFRHTSATSLKSTVFIDMCKNSRVIEEVAVDRTADWKTLFTPTTLTSIIRVFRRGRVDLILEGYICFSDQKQRIKIARLLGAANTLEIVSFLSSNKSSK